MMSSFTMNEYNSLQKIGKRRTKLRRKILKIKIPCSLIWNNIFAFFALFTIIIVYVIFVAFAKKKSY